MKHIHPAIPTMLLIGIVWFVLGVIHGINELLKPRLTPAQRRAARENYKRMGQ